MALERLYELGTRFYLASPLAFADWTTPTTAELNANATNNPSGLIWNLTCAIDQGDTTFNLDDAETDDSLTFCQRAGATNPTSYNPSIVYGVNRSAVPWVESTPSSFNTANLAFSLLAWRAIEYFAILSVGKDPDAPFAVGDRVKLARVGTSDPTNLMGSGENIRLQQTFRGLGDINWNYKLLV